MEWPASNCLYNPDTPSWNTVARQGTGIFYLGSLISLIACLISSLTLRLIPSSTVSFAINQNDGSKLLSASLSFYIKEPGAATITINGPRTNSTEPTNFSGLPFCPAAGANTDAGYAMIKILFGETAEPNNLQNLCAETGHHPNLLKYLHLSFVYKGRWRGCCA